MATHHPVEPLVPVSVGLPVAPTLAAALVRRLGARYSMEAGIDVDAGDTEVERWFVASTLFGARIAAKVAKRTFAILEKSGVHRIADVAGRERGELVALLDSGGYARYDFRTATKLQTLARQVAERYGGEVAELGRRFVEPDELAAALDDLTGWGPVTVALFLRELRGVWPGARPPLDRRAAEAGRHLELLCDEGGDELAHLALVARLSACDPRDLEAALVRLALAHPKSGGCRGGRECVMLARSEGLPSDAARRIALPGCRRVTIRPMRSDDGPELVALYASLDEEDVYRRFLTVRPPPATFVSNMAAVAERGGGGLIAAIFDPSGVAHVAASDGGGQGPRERIVAEATYSPLANGDAELGITVVASARGWLGPYLLDALLEDAAARGIPNLRADVLTANAQMFAMLRRRGYAVIGCDSEPALVRVAVGTIGNVPSWPGSHSARRVLVEAPGGRWHADNALRHAGFEVMVCASPPGGWAACPAWRGEPCPLAACADVIVDTVPGKAGRLLLDAHRRTHPSVPLCAELSRDVEETGPLAERILRCSPATAVAALLEQVVGPPEAPRTLPLAADSTIEVT
jgi:hypothetical protein